MYVTSYFERYPDRNTFYYVRDWTDPETHVAWQSTPADFTKLVGTVVYSERRQYDELWAYVVYDEELEANNVSRTHGLWWPWSSLKPYTAARR